MNDVTATPAAPTPVAPPPSVATPPVIERDWTPSDAGRLLAQRRAEKSKQAEPSPSAVNEAARQHMAGTEPPQELAPEANADPQAAAPSETTQAPEPEALPPIEPPRSWTQAEKERFASLPRETQEYLHTREQERDREFRRGQNEVAEKLKAIAAKEQEAEKARQQFESKLTSTVQAMEATLQAEFGDIQSIADVRKLQAEDPFRFQAWQVRQMELTAAKTEQAEAEQRKTHERQSKRSAYEAEQNKLLIDLVPEMADPKKANDLRNRAVAMLTDDLGLKNEQLSRWIADDTGHEILSNAGIQKLIADGLKYRDIKNAPKAVPEALPPVQRPGAGKAVVNSNSARIAALETQLSSASGVNQAKIMAQIRQLRKAG